MNGSQAECEKTVHCATNSGWKLYVRNRANMKNRHMNEPLLNVAYRSLSLAWIITKSGYADIQY